MRKKRPIAPHHKRNLRGIYFSAQATDYIDALILSGLYGETKYEVLRTLVYAGIVEALAKGVIPHRRQEF